MIRRALHAIGHSSRRFFRREEGGGAIELVLVLPISMAIFMASMESALYMTRQIMIERALDMTVRDLRLGILPVTSPGFNEVLKDEICEKATAVPTCREEIRIELRPVSTATWNLPGERTRCVDRDAPVQLDETVNPGGENELMIVRVCIRQDAMFPGTGIGEGIANSRGRYEIISVAAFVNEPT